MDKKHHYCSYGSFVLVMKGSKQRKQMSRNAICLKNVQSANGIEKSGEGAAL